MLDMYFVRGLVELKAEKKSDEDDDLIFFVSLEVHFLPLDSAVITGKPQSFAFINVFLHVY